MRRNYLMRARNVLWPINERLFIRHQFIYTLPKNEPIKFEMQIDNEHLNSYKHHPGLLKLKNSSLDKKLEETINLIASDHDVKSLLTEAQVLRKLIKNRRVPLEPKDIRNIMEYLKDEVFSNDSELAKLNPEMRDKLTKVEDNRFKKLVSKTILKWNPLNYTARTSLVYLIEFFSPNYAIMRQIFNEIELKHPDFKCERLFDFGSGVGTVMWAAKSIWKSEIKTYMNVDMSVHMNALSQLLIRGGNIDNQPTIQGVFFRQSLPVSSIEKYDIVTSAFSLIELSSFKMRLEVLKILWKKVAPGGFLVLVEYGTSHGFKLILEARELLLKQEWHKKNEKSEERGGEEEPSEDHKAHIFSPCPHEMDCPLSQINKKCAFRAGFMPVHLKEAQKPNEQIQEPYSYVVIRKGERNKDDKQWPRLVHEDPKKLSAAYHSYLCTKYGNVDHYIATKDRIIEMYRLVRYSSKVDQLPIDYRDSKLIKEDNAKIRRSKEKQTEEREHENLEK